MTACSTPHAPHLIPTDIGSHLPQVRRIARQMRAGLPSSVELDDLVQAGMLGLVTAARRFDASAGYPFMAFASHRIRGAMLDELRARDWLGRSDRRALRAFLQAGQRLAARSEGRPTDAAIADELAVSAEQIQHLRGLADVAEISLDEFEGHPALIDDNPAADPLGSLERSRQVEALACALSKIPERERSALEDFYFHGSSGTEIAARMGVCPSRVSQLIRQAVARLRQILAPTPETAAPARDAAAGARWPHRRHSAPQLRP